MKVLHVYRTYFPDPPGGLQEAIRQICITTNGYGVQNTVFALSPCPLPKVVQRPEARVVRCRSWAAPASCDLGALDAVSTFRQLVKECDVIHFLFPWPFADVLRTVAPRKPSVLTYISDIVRQRWLGMVYGPLMWHTLRSMDAIVSNAPGYAAGSAVLSEPSLQPLLRQIPLGIDESSYAIEPDMRVLDRLGLNVQESFLLFVGVLRYYKGLHVLVDACQHVKGRVVVAGDGPEMAALKIQAAALGVSNVVFAGHVTDAEKMALLKSCRGLVLPSHLRSEAYGMVLVEASMMGKPMVSCEIGTGTSFVNKHGETGWVVPPESPHALAGAMNRLLTDEAMAASYGRAARRRYETLFSGNAVGKAYADVFADVLTR